MYSLVFFLMFFVTSCNQNSSQQLDIDHITISPKSKYIIYQHLQSFMKKDGYTTPALWANATLKTKEDVYPTKIKIRGDLPKHWEASYSSYELNLYRTKKRQVKTDEFSYIRSEDKYYFIEGLSYLLAKNLGLVVPYFKYSYVSVNSQKINHYFVKRSFGKSFLENNFLRGSIIFKQRDLFKKQILGLPTYYRNIYSKNDYTNVFDFNAEFYEDVEHKSSSAILSNFFSNFRNDSNVELLDIEKYLKWIAIQLFFDSNHASAGDNKLWLYNRASMKFEPLLYDVLFREEYRAYSHRYFSLKRKNILFAELVKEPKFRKRVKEIFIDIIKMKDDIVKYLNSYEDLLISKDRQNPEFIFIKKSFLSNLEQLQKNYNSNK